jgi:hypothetical protein
MAKGGAADFSQSACRFGVKTLVDSPKFSKSGAMRDELLGPGTADGADWPEQNEPRHGTGSGATGHWPQCRVEVCAEPKGPGDIAFFVEDEVSTV